MRFTLFRPGATERLGLHLEQLFELDKIDLNRRMNDTLGGNRLRAMFQIMVSEF